MWKKVNLSLSLHLSYFSLNWQWWGFISTLNLLIEMSTNLCRIWRFVSLWNFFFSQIISRSIFSLYFLKFVFYSLFVVWRIHLTSSIQMSFIIDLELQMKTNKKETKKHIKKRKAQFNQADWGIEDFEFYATNNLEVNENKSDLVSWIFH